MLSFWISKQQFKRAWARVHPQRGGGGLKFITIAHFLKQFTKKLLHFTPPNYHCCIEEITNYHFTLVNTKFSAPGRAHTPPEPGVCV